MGRSVVTRLAPLVLGAVLLSGAPAHANDVIEAQKPSDGASFKTGAEVAFRFTALTQSSTVLPKIEVSTSGRINGDGSFVHADVVETTTATRVSNQANTYQVR